MCVCVCVYAVVNVYQYPSVWMGLLLTISQRDSCISHTKPVECKTDSHNIC